MGLSCTGEDATRILKLVLLKRRLFDEAQRPIIRSDNGPQFICEAFGKACHEVKVEHERIPYKTPNMNVYIESFHLPLEDECLAINEFEIYAQ